MDSHSPEDDFQDRSADFKKPADNAANRNEQRHEISMTRINRSTLSLLAKARQRIFGPPVFPDDTEKTRIAGSLNAIALFSALLIPLHLLVVLPRIIDPVSNFAHWLRPMAIFWVFIVIIVKVLLSRRHISAASTFMLLMGWAWLFVNALMTGGILSPTFASGLLVLTFAGLWGGRKTLVAFFAVISLSGAALLVLALRVPDTSQVVTPQRAFVVHLLLLLLSMGFTWFVLNSIDAAQQRIKASERKFRELVSRSQIGIFRTTPAGLLVETNPAMLQLLGFDTIEQVNAAGLANLYRKISDRLDFLSKVGEGPVSGFETQFSRSDGSVIDVALSAIPVHDSFGNLQFLEGTFEDITQRKRVEAALRESERRLADLIDFLPEAILVIDREKRVVIWNKAIEKMTGVDAQHMLGKGDFEYALPFYGKRRPILIDLATLPDDEIEHQYTTVRREGNVLIGETYLPLGGKNAYLLGRAIAIRNVHGEIVGAIEAISDLTERKQVEEDLKAANARIHTSEMKYRHLFEHSPMGIFQTDIAGNVLQANPAALKMLEFDDLDAVNREGLLNLYVDVADRERLISMVRKGPVSGFETLLRRSDGQSFPVSVGAYLVMDEANTPLCIEGTIEDISERKRAEEELRFRNIMLAAQQEVSIDGILVVDENGGIMSYNQKFVELWDIPPEVAQSASDERALHSVLNKLADPDGFLAKVKYLYAHRNETSRDEISLKDGRIFDRYSAPMTAADRKYYGRIWFFRDISDRKRAEALARRDELRLQSLLKISQYNPATVHELLNYALDEAIALSASRIGYIFRYDEETRKMELIAYSKLVMETCAIPDKESPVFHLAEVGLLGEPARSATPLIINDYSAPHPAKHGCPSGHLAITRFLSFPVIVDDRIVALVGVANKDDPYTEQDVHQLTLMMESIWLIAQRKEMEQEILSAKEAAETATRAKSSFLASMSHEIRTPMNAILGFTQLMLRDHGLTAQQRNYVDAIGRSGEHLLALINDILEMSKIEAGRTTFNPVVFDLHELIEDMRIMFKVRTDAKRLDWQVSRAREVPRYVSTDQNKLRQVLINLIGNAVKFTSRGGVELRVSAEPEMDMRQRLILDITDTGPGISAADTKNLFRHFEQATAGIKNGGGTGLGLAISREFARLMGGDISVESVPGQGSVFRVEITVSVTEAPADERRIELRRAVGLRSGGPPARILVVDDKADNREILVSALSTIGFAVREAEDGAAAVRENESWLPHLILMDLRMPGVDGYEATQRIRAEGINSRVVVIATTASAFDKDRREVLAAGVDDFIAKPILIDDLLEKIGMRLGVEYEYESCNEVSEETGAGRAIDSASLALSSVPTELLQLISHATITGDMEQLEELIGRLAEHSADAAQTVRGLVDNYDFEKLIALLRKEEEHVRDDP
jgi:two-component system sensor histidine kinase/response regulator